MSKYTTEVRFICEEAAGLKESRGYSDVENIIQLARPKIFDFDYPIFDQNYKGVLETKILKHFYTREIGSETVGLWKLRLNATMNEIMPWYNQLYADGLRVINPFITDDIEETHTKEIETTENGKEVTEKTEEAEHSETRSGESTESRTEHLEYEGERNTDISDTSSSTDGGDEVTTGSSAIKNTRWDKYSDTPQGSVQDLDADRYLSNARKIVDDGTGSTAQTTVDFGKTVAGTYTRDMDEDDSHSQDTTADVEGTQEVSTEGSNRNEINGTVNRETEGTTSESYLLRRVGRAGLDVVGVMERLRGLLLDVDMMIIADLEPLFMGLW